MPVIEARIRSSLLGFTGNHCLQWLRRMRLTDLPTFMANAAAFTRFFTAQKLWSIDVIGFLRRMFAAGAASTSSKRILQTFESQRQQLQEQFFVAASASGKPRGLKWTECDWLSSYTLVQDAESQMFTLFCGVNVSFEAVEGGDMEGVEAVSVIRDGSAVFHAQEGRWGTGGRVLFNVDPQTAATVAAAGQPVLAVADGTSSP